jgi:hypothetical protein
MNYHLGRVNYETYCKSLAWKFRDHEPYWPQLTTADQEAWDNAASAVIHQYLDNRIKERDDEEDKKD